MTALRSPALTVFSNSSIVFGGSTYVRFTRRIVWPPDHRNVPDNRVPNKVRPKSPPPPAHSLLPVAAKTPVVPRPCEHTPSDPGRSPSPPVPPPPPPRGNAPRHPARRVPPRRGSTRAG